MRQFEIETRNLKSGDRYVETLNGKDSVYQVLHVHKDQSGGTISFCAMPVSWRKEHEDPDGKYIIRKFPENHLVVIDESPDW